MTTRMLIDATHAEETRVVVIKGNRLEEFDYESATKKQLKGNIYLAKVTRVEPALQAAFVDYGGNRHGFLAFSEIHPDYYQIPVEDRQALIDEEAAEEEADEEEAEKEAGAVKAAAAEPAPSIAEDADNAENADVPEEAEAAEEEPAEAQASDETAEAAAEAEEGDEEAEASSEGGSNELIEVAQPAESVESVGADDELEEVTSRRARRARRYKIQEVIRRRQILLVQVVKEERGNKGAALTTYLSLAGRFCVLMPNTARGGGISRKIANAKDRKRLKSIIDGLELPEGMGVIVRTAGMEQNKREIKRDYDYLIRLWDTIREQTLKSTAPALIHEEGNLIKRSIRDLYSKDIDEVFVEGEEGYRTAKEFMRMLMPSHAKVVQPYKENIPLFARFQVEGQLDSMFSPTVHLKSGGYIVINSTEALVAVDVNSGRATREHNIEETALKTNLEAAEEVARQLRLRDLAGLIVIDFIDMEKHQNNRAVERRLKERLKHDRARIQVGRISAFGLLEMSRQRLRPGLLEATTSVCNHCAGTGIVRSTESSALQIIRAIEEEGIRGRSEAVVVHAPPTIMSYMLNQKRSAINDITNRYGMAVQVLADEELIAPNYTMDRTAKHGGEAEKTAEPVAEEKKENTPRPAAAARDEEGDDGRKSGKRRRRGRRRRGRGGEEGDEALQAHEAEAQTDEQAEESEANESAANESAEAPEKDAAGEDQPRKRRRRGRRGGRSRRRDGEKSTAEAAADGSEPNEAEAEAEPSETAASQESKKEKPAAETVEQTAESAPEPAETDPADTPAEEPARAAESSNGHAEPEPETEPETSEESAAPPRPARKGWWQRRTQK